MKLTNTAKIEKGYIEKNITVQNLPNEEYLVEVKAIPTGKKKEEYIKMTFSQNAFNALVGTMSVFCNE